MLMENFLRSKEYWVVVENGFSAAAEGVTLFEAQKKTYEEQKLKDLKAKNYLFQALDRSILETIINKDTSKIIWDSMKKKYEGTTRVKRAHLQALRKEFETAHMKEGESVNEYLARVLVISNKMKANGDDLKEVAVVEKILRSMTSKFNYVMCSIEESKDTSILSIDELQSSLLVHEQRMSNTVHEEHALKVTQSNQYAGPAGRGRGRWNSGGRGRGRSRQNIDKATVECYNCHKLGHFQWECKQGVTNFAESQVESAEEHMLLMAYVETKEQQKTDVWFLDSRCNNHMCGKKEYFSKLDETFSDSVKLGNNSNG
uniref:Retrovirus-related Pol polyprotein from transposon TNT 1-94 n=1 Tax=Cajanus cajan TaxID=3821 RepID=A0A151STR5_CAJCA|nr:Retrovirus-related Pol polyprotein from transposon TNT 1-94 [Cajanus cajan]